MAARIETARIEYEFAIERNPETYEQALYVKENSFKDGTEAWKEKRVVHLWSITLWNPLTGTWMTPVLVMAPTKEIAMGQAQCKHKLNSYDLDMPSDEHKRQVEDTAKCEQVPFLMPGFGRIEF